VDVTFKTRTKRSAVPGGSSMGGFPMTDFLGAVVSPALKVDKQVFSAGGQDPHQCCAHATADALTFDCNFSGIDQIHGEGAARREGDDLVIRWCTADLSTGSVLDRGEVKTPLPKATDIRFKAPAPECDPARLP
jgi:hypothetical protein